MELFKKLIYYILAIIVIFYVLPITIVDTGSGITMLLIVIPVLVAIVSLIQGYKQGFTIYFPLIVSLLFIPAMYIHLNSSAWIYVPIYGVISLITSFIGSKLTKKK